MNQELRQRAETEIVTAIFDYEEDPHKRAEKHAARALNRLLRLLAAHHHTAGAKSSAVPQWCPLMEIGGLSA
ncbi:hypothetical protein HMPREF2943_03010 [Corynebacterium sp. HMSC072D12]|uniref:hypothetical protein n=1 Tax=Corynebacterium sp. HMSC072D12 TaxID=1739447 RepID=UPI0008A4801F|nr:hypothetical protein [Corynebacterium sp. HMSC072D12]OFQ33998.1 hypothetical protein HMPREF2943_03010 [Corynebacterium sp. HMSC072D12]